MAKFLSSLDKKMVNFPVKLAVISSQILVFVFRAFSGFSGFFGLLGGLAKFSGFSGFGLRTLFTSGRAFRASGSSPKQH